MELKLVPFGLFLLHIWCHFTFLSVQENQLIVDNKSIHKSTIIDISDGQFGNKEY